MDLSENKMYGGLIKNMLQPIIGKDILVLVAMSPPYVQYCRFIGVFEDFKYIDDTVFRIDFSNRNLRIDYCVFKVRVDRAYIEYMSDNVMDSNYLPEIAAIDSVLEVYKRNGKDWVSMTH